jgi:flagellar hook protein FlgE
MSLYGLLTTGASGMSAESTLLGTVADNIGNIDTTGYKNTSAEFSSMVLGAGGSNYQSGSVLANTRVSIDAQGPITSTTGPTDLAIQGSGFFNVQDTSGNQLLTRAGSFVEDAKGNLVNSAGYMLMGTKTGDAAGVLSVVNLNNYPPDNSSATTNGQLTVNLDSTSPTQVGNTLPSSNTANALYTQKTQLTAYEKNGSPVTLDVYLTNVTPTAGPPTWEVDVFDAGCAGPASTNGFPYAPNATDPDPTPQLTSGTTPPTLTFDPITGKQTSAGSIIVTMPDGHSMTLDMSQTTQLAASYSITQATANGSGASPFSHISIDSGGTVDAVYKDGTTSQLYSIPLATVRNPDGMTVKTGNAFETNRESGAVNPNGGTGTIQTSALENSTVDLSAQLTSMIEAQNNYQANSKVFETGSKLLQVLVSLQQ